jgi:hypothetical protein
VSCEDKKGCYSELVSIKPVDLIDTANTNDLAGLSNPVQQLHKVEDNLIPLIDLGALQALECKRNLIGTK